MTRSSTSSSEAVASRSRRLIQFRPRILSASFAAIVLMMGAVECALQIPAVADRLPLPTHFNEPDVAMRLRILEALKRQEDVQRIDVLFVGSSIVRCNIRPNLFDEALSRQAHAQVISFNAGLSGLWPPGVEFYTEHLWLPHARPRLVLQGIRFAELIEPSRTRPYDQIITGAVESGWHRGGLSGWMKAAAFEHLRLLQYRGIWTDWLKRHVNGRGSAPVRDELRVYTDPRGWTPRLPTLDVVRARNLVAAEQPYGVLSRDALLEAALDAIRHVARAARRSGAEYALVNVPEHAFRWSGPDGPRRYHRYIAQLQRLADYEGFAFIDVTAGSADQFSHDADYSDYYHMSPDGAGRFTAMLATAIAALPAKPAGPPAPARTATPVPELTTLGLRRAAAGMGDLPGFGK